MLLLAAAYGLINATVWMDVAGLAIAAMVLGLRYVAVRRLAVEAPPAGNLQ